MTRRRALDWRPGHVLGTAPECAADFADKVWPGAEAGIYPAEIPGRAVFDVIGGPREQEIVVNPGMLRGRIVLVERLAAKPLLPWPPQ